MAKFIPPRPLLAQPPLYTIQPRPARETGDQVSTKLLHRAKKFSANQTLQLTIGEASLKVKAKQMDRQGIQISFLDYNPSKLILVPSNDRRDKSKQWTMVPNSDVLRFLCSGSHGYFEIKDPRNQYGESIATLRLKKVRDGNDHKLQLSLKAPPGIGKFEIKVLSEGSQVRDLHSPEAA